jgi:hypothetical protein
MRGYKRPFEDAKTKANVEAKCAAPTERRYHEFTRTNNTTKAQQIC